jgi:hypothetical protein
VPRRKLGKSEHLLWVADGAERRKLAEYATLSVDEKFELLAREVYDVVIGDGDKYMKLISSLLWSLPWTPTEMEPWAALSLTMPMLLRRMLLLWLHIWGTMTEGVELPVIDRLQLRADLAYMVFFIQA